MASPDVLAVPMNGIIASHFLHHEKGEGEKMFYGLEEKRRKGFLAEYTGITRIHFFSILQGQVYHGDKSLSQNTHRKVEEFKAQKRH